MRHLMSIIAYEDPIFLVIILLLFVISYSVGYYIIYSHIGIVIYIKNVSTYFVFNKGSTWHLLIINK